MIDIDLDYYLLEVDNKYTAPLLVNDYDVDPEGIDIYSIESLEKTLAHLTFNEPIPKTPQMVDYLHFECRAVFSKKICNAFKGTSVNGLQFIPTIITDEKGEEYKDYWIANVYNEYAFLDPEESERKGSINSRGRWSMIKRMVIDTSLIKKVPLLEERLVFVPTEGPGYVLYHKSIVDLIMSVNPEGLVFVPISEWHNGI